MRRPRIEPAVGVIVFVAVETLLIWGIVQMAGPGRPSDGVVLLSVAAPVVVALAFGWFLTGSSED